MESLSGEALEVFVEIGTGKVLVGLIKRIGRGWALPFTMANVEDVDSLGKTKTALS